jgi:hypothetical protein
MPILKNMDIIKDYACVILVPTNSGELGNAAGYGWSKVSGLNELVVSTIA